ncbi:MAG TPA: transposase [Thermoanaerobaculia bacterium]|nr:transposase [Thermoanaerobaculia bacterium]
MARPLRLQFAGAVYHVMARGHERSAIFRDAEDRSKFLALLEQVATEEKWIVHAYCLLGNHFHVLIETPEGALARGMRDLNGRYAQWFNWRHDRRGHVFEGRYRSVVVEKQTHLMELHRYIVLNPVRARLAERPSEWRWSSYRATVGSEKAPAWLETDWTLGQFGGRRSSAREAFQRFVSAGKVAGKEVEALERAAYLGGREFLKRMQELVSSQEKDDEIPRRYRKASAQVKLEDIRRQVAREWDVKEEALPRRRGGDDKKAAIYLARKLTRLGGREIGREFGVKAARVSNVVSQIDADPSTPLARRIKRLAGRLRPSA